MKTFVKLALGGGVALASVSANAAGQLQLPSTGNTNLVFYVADLTTKATYAVDLLGQSVQGGSVMENGVATATGSGYFTAADALSSTTQGVVNPIFGDANFQYNLSGDTALVNFINGLATTDTVEWGVYATGYVPSNRDLQGNTLTITTGTAANVVTIGDTQLTGTVTGKQNSDFNSLNTNYASSKDTFTAAPGTAKGVFGTSTSPSALTFYGNGMNTGQTIGGSAVTLYGLTGNGTGGANAIAFSLGSISFVGDVLTFTGNIAQSVPIPGAVWLLGSGLLGLLGIGRRRERLAA